MLQHLSYKKSYEGQKQVNKICHSYRQSSQLQWLYKEYCCLYLYMNSKARMSSFIVLDFLACNAITIVQTLKCDEWIKSVVFE